MTVDVEDYFQVSAFERHIPRRDWDSIPCRVVDNTRRVLALFSECGVKGTFFTLGWVAERFPTLVREIVEERHELASHGYQHIRATQQSSQQFREDVLRTKHLLEDLSGSEVKGYRAASYSIGTDNLWALDVLAEVGYQYSSSIYPIKHDLYGMPKAPRFAFRHGTTELLEVPVSTVRVMRRTLPSGGGGYFRLFPYKFSRWAIRRVNAHDGQPSVFYFHPWELDPQQPRQTQIPLKTRIRHYLNLHRMEDRLRRLIADFKWDRMDKIFLCQSPGGAT